MRLTIKKIFCSTLMFIVCSGIVFADEGMWLLPLLQRMNAQQMREAGCMIPPSAVYQKGGTSLKNAIVQFGNGCTGEVISDEGLIITNHHCGYSSIQKLSSTEHDYLKDGYWAMNRSEELPVEGLTVTFLEYMEDVTPEWKKFRDKVYVDHMKEVLKDEPEEYADLMRDLKEEPYNYEIDKDYFAMREEYKFRSKVLKEASERNPGCDVYLEELYDDNVLYLIVTKTFTDIRFVGAPPSSIGKFGADTDNWMWPRHTGDFSLFRIYADKNNEPADYSPGNVPYSPKNHLKISLSGVSEGDYTMIMGYPGRTTRFQTSSELKEQLAINDIRIAARTIRQDIMRADMKADAKINIQYANKYASSSNGWKKWKGMKVAFEKLDVIGRAEQQEKEFTEWVNENTNKDESLHRKALYGNALSTIQEGVECGAKAQRIKAYLTESIYRIELPLIAVEYVATIGGTIRHGGDSLTAFKDAYDKVTALYKDYSPTTDRKIAKAMLKFYRDNVEPDYYLQIPGIDFATVDFDNYVDDMFETSVFASAEKFENTLLNRDFEAIVNDPAIALVRAIQALGSDLREVFIESDYLLMPGRKAYTAGLLEWRKGEPSYPDANSTMRLTYGNVMPYSPKDGVIYKHYTTLAGVMEKEDPDNWEFVVPQKLKELYKNKDFGRYAMEDGRMPVAFITNNDITGGNSGSPVLNAYGELVGLAFDGNWESMSSDVMFEPDLQRCINVDIRYVLFIIDKFAGAGYLIDEMQIVNRTSHAGK